MVTGGLGGRCAYRRPVSSEHGGSEPDWATRRLSFGAGAVDYDRYRPGYPDEAVRWCAGTAGARVVDVGAGTGRFAAAAGRLGYDVLAVEPDPGMRAVAEQSLPGRVVEGSAEAIPLPDASVDTVTAAQAHHWFDPQRSHLEIARVLHPDGQFAALWNFRDDRVPWVRELYALIGGEDHLTAARDVTPLDMGELFGPEESARWEHTQELSREDFLGLVGSYSYVALRADTTEVLESVADLVATHPDLKGRDTVRVPYVTKAIRALRH